MLRLSSLSARGLLSEKVEPYIGKIARYAYRRPLPVLAVTLLLVSGAAYEAGRIRLDTDVIHLLPESSESVQNLSQLQDRLGNFKGSLSAARSSTTTVDSGENADFFETRALYYLSIPDLEAILSQATLRSNWEKQRMNPLLADLEDGEAPALPFREALKRLDGGPIGYLASSSTIGEARPFWHPSLTSPQNPSDLLQTGFPPRLIMTILSALGLMLLILAGYFRRISAAVLVLTPLLVGMVVTFGAAHLVIERLHIWPAAAAGLLLSLGIGQGMHLLSRYQTGLANAPQDEDAVCEAFAAPGRAVVLVTLTLLAGCLVLSGSAFIGFQQFGILAALGVILVALAYLLVLPALLRLTPGFRRTSSSSFLVGRCGELTVRYAPAVFFVALLGCVLASSRAGQVDFRFSALEAAPFPGLGLGQNVDPAPPRAPAPLVALLEEGQSGAEVAEALRARRKERGKKTAIDFVVAPEELVPTQQKEKEAILRRIRRLVEDVPEDTLNDRQASARQKLIAMSESKPFSKEDLPKNSLAAFQTAHEAAGLALVFPRRGASDGRRMFDLAEEVRGVSIQGATHVPVAGQALVVSEVFQQALAEAPGTMALGSFSVLCMLLLLLGNLGRTLTVLVPAALTVSATLGLMQVFGLELDTPGFLLFPMLFGLTLSSAAFQAVESEEREITAVGRPIVGTVFVVGLAIGTMLFVDPPALEPLVKVFLLGLLVHLFVSLALTPSFLHLTNLLNVHRKKLRPGATNRSLAVEGATIGGAGLASKGPGTIGTVAALVFVPLFAHLPFWARLLWVLALLPVAWFATRAYLLGHEGDDLDPSEVVIDEFIGMWLTLLFVPLTWMWTALAFVLFRAFDILKPGPVGFLDRHVKGALGVNLDDLAAGFLAGLVLLAAQALLPF